MKDLFTGSLGRLNNHGGSRMFTTPITRYVPHDYSVETNIPSAAEFVTCSLDGRLWVFRRSRRYYVAVFRWNEISQRLVFVKSEILSNANFIGRGIDWVLTDSMIIQASDGESYVATANLFNDDESAILYSLLRSKDFTSGIDPITNSAWGLSDNNGNSEGYAYFNRSAFLQSVNKHYSQIPTVGDWNIIKNFLVRKPDNALSEAHNNMLNIRPLIPLEFYGSKPAYGCGFDNDIFLTHQNGELWGRGLYHIGKCYILPAVFDEEGNPQEFYLYISPDFPRIAVTQDEKIILGILKTTDNVYGFLTTPSNSLDNGLCYSSDNQKIFAPSANEWQDFLENHEEELSEEEQQSTQNVQTFIDTLNHSGLVLHNEGAIFLDSNSYQCKGLRQWFAPAGTVDAVSGQYVFSSCDNSALVTHCEKGFYREALNSKNLSLSAKAYSGKRLSLGVADVNNVKSIHVNSITANNGTEPIAWENVYRQPISIRKINSFSHNFNGTFANGQWPAFNNGSIQSSILPPDLVNDGYHANMYSFYEGGPEFFITQFVVRDEWGTFTDDIATILGTRYGWPRDTAGYTYWCVPGASYSCNSTIFYIDPVSGEYHDFTLSTNFSNNYSYGAIGTDAKSLGYVFDFTQDSTLVADAPLGITIQDGQIGYSYVHNTLNTSDGSNGGHSETLFKPMVAVSDILPASVQNWQNNSGGNLTLQSIQIPKNIPQNVTCPASAIFSEKNSKVNFACDIPSIFKSANGSKSGTLANIKNIWYQYYNYWNINSLSEDKSFYTQGLHIAICNSQNNEPLFIVFRSEISPQIFDFHSEVERSIS